MKKRATIQKAKRMEKDSTMFDSDDSSLRQEPAVAARKVVRIPSPRLSLDQFESKYGMKSSPGYAGYSDQSPSAPLPASQTRYEKLVERGELKDVIQSLEHEFDSLNDQYRRLLSSGVSEGRTTSEELVSVINKLHKKGEQLRALKSPIKD